MAVVTMPSNIRKIHSRMSLGTGVVIKRNGRRTRPTTRFCKNETVRVGSFIVRGLLSTLKIAKSTADAIPERVPVRISPEVVSILTSKATEIKIIMPATTSLAPGYFLFFSASMIRVKNGKAANVRVAMAMPDNWTDKKNVSQ